MSTKVSDVAEKCMCGIANSFTGDKASCFNAYKEIFLDCDEGRSMVRRVVSKMMTLAHICYSREHDRMVPVEPTRLVETCGALSESFFKQFEFVKSAWKMNDEDAIEQIGKLVDFMEKKGWFGLPTYVDSDNRTVYKTIHGVFTDMARHLENVNAYRKYLKEKADEERQKKRGSK